MSGFTLGPLTVYEKTHVMKGRRLVANTGGYSSNVNSSQVRKENEANALLFAAAPALYKVVDLYMNMENTPANELVLMKKAEAALILANKGLIEKETAEQLWNERENALPADTPRRGKSKMFKSEDS